VTTCVVEHTGVQASRPAKGAKLAPQQQWAMAALIDALAGAGRSGHYGCPANVPTVPEELWRDTFYKSSMPGSSQDGRWRVRAASPCRTRHASYLSAMDGRCSEMRAGPQREQLLCRGISLCHSNSQRPDRIHILPCAGSVRTFPAFPTFPGERRECGECFNRRRR
jgi:hypothetical protein